MSRWTHLKSTPEDSMQKKCQRPWKVTISNSQSQMEQLKSHWRRQTSENIHFYPGYRTERGEEQESFPRERGGLSSLSPHQHYSTLDDAEAKIDFWSFTGDFIYRHHVEPRVKMHMPERRIIFFSAEVCRRYQKYFFITSCNAGIEHWLLLECWWRVVHLSDTWTGFKRVTILKEKPPDGFSWSGRRLTRKQTTSRPEKLWPEMWKHMSGASKRKEKQKMGDRKTETRSRQEFTWCLLHWSGG